MFYPPKKRCTCGCGYIPSIDLRRIHVEGSPHRNCGLGYPNLNQQVGLTSKTCSCGKVWKYKNGGWYRIDEPSA